MKELIDTINKYLTGETSLNPSDVVYVFIITLILGLYIFWVYRFQTKSEFYSKDFNVTLPGLAVITAGIMIAMQANLLVSLGMVGSLSIVRFRTAVKNPMDLLYLFWSISVGIISGVGLYSLAVLLSVCVTLILFGFKYVYEINSASLLVISAEKDIDAKEVENIINEFSKKNKLSSLIIKNENAEYIYELQSLDSNTLANKLNGIKGVKSVNVISHVGDRRF